MDNSNMDSQYSWTIYSGEWMDGGSANSLKELTDDICKIERLRLTSPTMRLYVSYKYMDGYFTITNYFESGRRKFKGDLTNNEPGCESQNWLIIQLNNLTK